MCAGRCSRSRRLHHLERRCRVQRFASCRADADLVASATPDLHVGARAQKRVAADLLAALDRLQQKGCDFVAGNRQKGGDRGKQVGAHRLTTGTSVASRAGARISLKSGCSIAGKWQRFGNASGTRGFHQRGRDDEDVGAGESTTLTPWSSMPAD